MGAAECGRFVDEPRCFVIVVKQKITCAQEKNGPRAASGGEG